MCAALFLVMLFQVSGPTPRPSDSGGKAKTTESGKGTQQDQAPAIPGTLGGQAESNNAADIANQTNADIDKYTGQLANYTFFLVIVGILQLIVFGVQAAMLLKTIGKMDAIAKEQGKDMGRYIEQATRTAVAMEGVSAAMELNAVSVRESVAISREIADNQKVVMELQSRAYLSATFNAAKYQDANVNFEAQVLLKNCGSTPAYNVTFRADVGILPSPIPANFDFPLPNQTAGGSISFIAPGLNKMLPRVLPYRVSSAEVEAIKDAGPPKCFVMWGIINYEDAFRKSRFVKFAFIVSWVRWVEGKGFDKDGNPIEPQAMSHDLAGHNDAD